MEESKVRKETIWRNFTPIGELVGVKSLLTTKPVVGVLQFVQRNLNAEVSLTSARFRNLNTSKDISIAQLIKLNRVLLIVGLFNVVMFHVFKERSPRSTTIVAFILTKVKLVLSFSCQVFGKWSLNHNGYPQFLGKLQHISK